LDIVKKNGFYTCYVTNGYIAEDPLREISFYLDAMNIDIKAFDDEFYKDICKAKLTPVLETCVIAKEMGIHIELTYLVIPGLNDSIGEIECFLDWVIKNLGVKTPIHFSRFHPDYKMKQIPPTPINKLIEIYKIAKNKGFLYPYLGNVVHGDYENTFCPKCGNVVIKRDGFSINIDNFIDKRCAKCGYELPILNQKYKKQKI
jgi:pyruvate formate lyase activating enzyme